MLFVPKWKSSAWYLPSNLFHSHRLHNASNFCSKSILNWMSAWRSCTSGSSENWTRLFGEWLSRISALFPSALEPSKYSSQNHPWVLAALKLSSWCLLFSAGRAEMHGLCLPEGWLQLPYVTQQSKYQHWPSVLSSFTPCSEPSCCVWGCLGGVSCNSDFKSMRATLELLALMATRAPPVHKLGGEPCWSGEWGEGDFPGGSHAMWARSFESFLLPFVLHLFAVRFF